VKIAARHLFLLQWLREKLAGAEFVRLGGHKSRTNSHFTLTKITLAAEAFCPLKLSNHLKQIFIKTKNQK